MKKLIPALLIVTATATLSNCAYIETDAYTPGYVAYSSYDVDYEPYYWGYSNVYYPTFGWGLYSYPGYGYYGYHHHHHYYR